MRMGLFHVTAVQVSEHIAGTRQVVSQKKVPVISKGTKKTIDKHSSDIGNPLRMPVTVIPEWVN